MALSEYARTAVDWIASHPAETWLCVSLVINVALRARTPEQWIALAERRPWLAACLEVVRALGVDPARALRALQLVVNAKAGGGALRSLVAPHDSDGPTTPRSGGGSP